MSILVGCFASNVFESHAVTDRYWGCIRMPLSSGRGSGGKRAGQLGVCLVGVPTASWLPLSVTLGCIPAARNVTGSFTGHGAGADDCRGCLVVGIADKHIIGSSSTAAVEPAITSC